MNFFLVLLRYELKTIYISNSKNVEKIKLVNQPIKYLKMLLFCPNRVNNIFGQNPHSHSDS